MQADLIQSEGYPVETHTVTTEDGYILTLHRIPRGRTNATKVDGDSGKKKVAFLQHGLLCSSSDWIILGPGKGLGKVVHGFYTFLVNASKVVLTANRKDSNFPTTMPLEIRRSVQHVS